MCKISPMLIASLVFMASAVPEFITTTIELGGSGLQSPEALMYWRAAQTVLAVAVMLVAVAHATCRSVSPKRAWPYVSFGFVAVATSALSLMFAMLQYMRYRNNLTASDFVPQCGSDTVCQAYNSSLSTCEWRNFCAVSMSMFVVVIWAFMTMASAEKSVRYTRVAKQTEDASDATELREGRNY